MQLRDISSDLSAQNNESITILVVDDERLNRIVLSKMLKEQGFSVLSAENGQEALQLYHSHRVDLVLLDIMMPVMDGYQTAKALKASTTDRYVPVIYITALEDMKLLASALDIGGDDFIPKPFEQSILFAKVHAHLRIRDLLDTTLSQNKALTYYQHRVHQEHELVEHIFANAINKDFELPVGVDSHLSAATTFNGDVFISAVAPTGAQYYLLGDFTGHGLAAAIGALPVHSAFYSMVKKSLSVADIAKEINTILERLLPANMFFAAAIIEVNASANVAHMWLGGLPDIYITDAQGQVLQAIESMHMALGILEEDEFDVDIHRVELSANQRIVLYTDGIIEAHNKHGQMFDYERLRQALKHNAQPSTQTVLERVNAFTGGGEQQDDYSIVIIDPQSHNPQELTAEPPSTLPFHISLLLDAPLLQNTDPVAQLVDLVASIEGLKGHKSNLFVIFSESFNNALEHGLLALDSDIKNTDDGFLHYYQLRAQRLSSLSQGHIAIDMRFDPLEQALHICVSDSGAAIELTTPKPSSEKSHGRGLALLSALSDDFHFDPQSKKFNITYRIS